MHDPSVVRSSSLGHLLRHLRHDLPAGLVVFLVALPLCLGIALACGVPLLSGLVAGIVGGLVVASLSGSQVSVSGPAAGLVVIVVDAILTLGSFNAFLVAVVLAGALQWVFGRLRAGNLGACFPSQVIKGMLAAIGLLLIIKQLPVAFGFMSMEHAMEHIPSDAQSLAPWRNALDAVTGSALFVAVVAVVLLFAWESPNVRRIPVLGRLPGPLVAVLWGMAYQAVAEGTDSSAALGEHHRVALPTFDSLGALLAQTATPDWSVLARADLYVIALTLAVVASLETLLSLEAADKLDPLSRISPPNKELQAQGIGNIVSGLLGGLPITAVIVRSSANIQAGARTKMSAVLHGVLLLGALFLAGLLSWIPLAALSAVLLHTGYKLAKPALFVSAWRQGLPAFVPFAVTVVAILATDLLLGIVMGLASGLLFVIYANTRGAMSLTSHEGAHLLRFCKDVSFFSRAKLRSYLEQVRPGDSLIIDGSGCHFIDRDIRETLNDFTAHAAQRGIDVECRALPSEPETMLPSSRWGLRRLVSKAA